MISTHWKECHEPSERELRMFDILARLAADLIERTRHEEEARRREERLRILTQLLTDVPWQARGDGAFGDLQLAWENFTGQSWDQYAGHGWFDAIHPDDARPGAKLVGRGLLRRQWLRMQRAPVARAECRLPALPDSRHADPQRGRHGARVGRFLHRRGPGQPGLKIM
jgi:PAS domain-containing protein